MTPPDWMVSFLDLPRPPTLTGAMVIVGFSSSSSRSLALSLEGAALSEEEAEGGESSESPSLWRKGHRRVEGRYRD